MSERKLVHLVRKRKCDFCGKTQDEVAVLIVAPEKAADICDECVGVCVEVLAARAAKLSTPSNLVRPAED